jgi:8-oxo-dGTP diphosphatase
MANCIGVHFYIGKYGTKSTKSWRWDNDHQGWPGFAGEEEGVAWGGFAFPGGHLEYMESFEDCAQRETDEECGIKIKNIRFQFLVNLTKYAPKHYVHIGLSADWAAGAPEVREPEKCESWDWYEMDKLPQPLFETCKLAIDSFRTGTNYYGIATDGD